MKLSIVIAAYNRPNAECTFLGEELEVCSVEEPKITEYTP